MSLAVLSHGLIGALAPPGADLCALSGYQYLNGRPVPYRDLHFTAVTPGKYGTSALLENTPVKATTDADGAWSLVLVQGQSYLVNCPAAGLKDKRIIIPAASTALLAALL